MRSQRLVNYGCFLVVALLSTGFGQNPVQPQKLPSKTLVGKVVAVADGDTFTVLDAERKQHKIRLEGIDSPEAKQAFGTKAKEGLAERVFGQQVKVLWDETDRYDRKLGHVFLGSRWVNYELVGEGWAWHFVKYSSDPNLARAEREARKERRGLWADPHPVAPWDFRHPPKTEASTGEHCGPTEGRACAICGG